MPKRKERVQWTYRRWCVTTPENAQVALELERLRGTVEVGFARTDGALDLLVQRSNQAEKDYESLSQRVTMLERSKWPLASITAVAAVGAVAVAMWQASGR